MTHSELKEEVSKLSFRELLNFYTEALCPKLVSEMKFIVPFREALSVLPMRSRVSLSEIEEQLSLPYLSEHNAVKEEEVKQAVKELDFTSLVYFFIEAHLGEEHDILSFLPTDTVETIEEQTEELRKFFSSN
jgi:hypothetical protein